MVLLFQTTLALCYRIMCEANLLLSLLRYDHQSFIVIISLSSTHEYCSCFRWHTCSSLDDPICCVHQTACMFGPRQGNVCSYGGAVCILRCTCHYLILFLTVCTRNNKDHAQHSYVQTASTALYEPLAEPRVSQHSSHGHSLVSSSQQALEEIHSAG